MINTTSLIDDFKELQDELCSVIEVLHKNYQRVYEKAGSYETKELRDCEYRFRGVLATSTSQDHSRIMEYFEANAGVLIDLQAVLPFLENEEQQATILSIAKLNALYYKNGFTETDPGFGIPIRPDDLDLISS